VNSLLESICKLCEKKYKVFRYLVKSGQKFCSFECYWKSLKGRPTWNKGKKCSSISKGKLGKTTANKGRVFSKEWRDKLSRALMDKKVSLEARKKMSLAKKGCNSPMLGKHHSEETKAKLREIRLKQKFTIEQIRKSLIRRPMSSLEIKVKKVIEKHNLPYKFVGNGKFWIERKNPDFININGEKKAVEVYWKEHKDKFRGNSEQWMKNRQKIFNKYGWQIIFLEAKELTELQIINALSKGGELQLA